MPTNSLLVFGNLPTPTPAAKAWPSRYRGDGRKLRDSRTLQGNPVWRYCFSSMQINGSSMSTCICKATHSDVYTNVLKQEMSQEDEGVCPSYVHFKSSWFHKIIWILGLKTIGWRDVGLFKGPWQKQTRHKGCLARCLQGLWPVHFIPTSQDVSRKIGLVRETLQNGVTI